jgi:hypothetical protein
MPSCLTYITRQARRIMASYGNHYMPGMTPYKASGFFFSPMMVLHIDRADRVLRFYPVDLLGIPACVLFSGYYGKESRVCWDCVEGVRIVLECSIKKRRSQSDYGLGSRQSGKRSDRSAFSRVPILSWCIVSSVQGGLQPVPTCSLPHIFAYCIADSALSPCSSRIC